MSIMIPSMIFKSLGIGHTCFLNDSMTDKEKSECENIINGATGIIALAETIESENEYKGFEFELDLEKLACMTLFLFNAFGYWKEKDEESYEWTIAKKISVAELKKVLKKMNAGIIKIQENKILISPISDDFMRELVIPQKPIIKMLRFLPSWGSRTKKLQNITHCAYIAYIIQHLGTNIANKISLMDKRLSIESNIDYSFDIGDVTI